MATAEEAVKEATIITGALLIHLAPVVVLLDSGSMHTFMSKKFNDWIDVPIDDLGYDLVVSTPSREILTTGVCVRGIAIGA